MPLTSSQLTPLATTGIYAGTMYVKRGMTKELGDAGCCH